MSRPIIEVNGISKRYRLGDYGFSSFREETEKWWRRLRGAPVEEAGARDFWALRDVSFSVQPGEVVGLIGRNGAGKSTLLKILSRITEPTAGEAVLRGRVASLLEVGTGFHPELSGRENVFLNGAILGMTKAEITRKFDEIVTFAEIEQFIDTPVKRYSSGMYVRLAFAVAAHLEPEILIVDEVLAVGDVAFQRKCVGRMDAVAKEGRTVLFVSHNLGLVDMLCSRGVCMEEGRVRVAGTAAEAIAAYNDAQKAASDKVARAGKPISSVRVTPVESDQSLFRAEAGFRLEIGLSAPRDSRTAAVVWVRNAGGVNVHHYNSWLSDPGADGGRMAGFCLEVPKAALPPGEYRFDIELWRNGEKVDRIDSACQMEIVDGLFDGRPAKHWVGKGVSLSAHQWKGL